jgi:hypothetical protein
MEVDKSIVEGIVIVLTDEEAEWLMRLIQNDVTGTESEEDAEMRLNLWQVLHHVGVSVL